MQYQQGAFCEHEAFEDCGIVCPDCVLFIPSPPASPKAKRRDAQGHRLTAKGQRVKLSNGKYAR